MVRGGNDANIYLEPVFAADASDLVLLEDAQEARLHVCADAADFVEKAGAALSFFENSLLICQRSGKGAPHMAEEFTFENRLGQCSTIHGDKGTVGSRTVLVNRLSNQFLTCAAFAEDERGASGRGNPRDGLINFQHGRTLADDFSKLRVIIAPAVAGFRAALQRPLR